MQQFLTDVITIAVVEIHMYSMHFMIKMMHHSCLHMDGKTWVEKQHVWVNHRKGMDPELFKKLKGRLAYDNVLIIKTGNSVLKFNSPHTPTHTHTPV